VAAEDMRAKPRRGEETLSPPDIQTLGLAGRMFRKSAPVPIYLIHFVTFACVARCPHCFVSDRPGAVLGLEAVERLARSLRGQTWSVMLTGGEPTVRPDLADIALAYLKLGQTRYVQVATNGLLPEALGRTCETVLFRVPPGATFSVALSLDGVGPEHDRLRGVAGAWDKAMETLTFLKSITDPRFRYLVNITVSAASAPGLKELYRTVVDDLKVRNVTFTLTRGRPRDPDQLEVSPAFLRAFLEGWEADLRRGRLGYRGLHLGRLIDAQNVITRRRGLAILEGRSFSWPCYAGTLAGVIWPDGRVSPCEALPDFGSLTEPDLDLARLWRSEAAGAFRRSRRPEACQRCTHECFWLVNVLFNPRLLPRLACLAARMGVGR